MYYKECNPRKHSRNYCYFSLSPPHIFCSALLSSLQFLNTSYSFFLYLECFPSLAPPSLMFVLLANLCTSLKLKAKVFFLWGSLSWPPSGSLLFSHYCRSNMYMYLIFIALYPSTLLGYTMPYSTVKRKGLQSHSRTDISLKHRELGSAAFVPSPAEWPGHLFSPTQLGVARTPGGSPVLAQEWQKRRMLHGVYRIILEYSIFPAPMDFKEG